MAKVTGPLMSIDASGAFCAYDGLCQVERDQLQQAVCHPRQSQEGQSDSDQGLLHLCGSGLAGRGSGNQRRLESGGKRETAL